MMYSYAYDMTKHIHTKEMNIQHQEKMRGTPDEYSLLFSSYFCFVYFILRGVTVDANSCTARKRIHVEYYLPLSTISP